MTTDSMIRLAAFGSALGLMFLWEGGSPRLRRIQPRWGRWTTNAGLGVLGVILVRFTVGALAFMAARWAQEHAWGLFNVVSVAPWLGGSLAFLALDLGIYAQHIVTHAWSPLWRLHRVHHADLDMDVTTALRFHPLEILLSMGYKTALVLLLGAPPLAVIAFEVTLSLGSLFTHTNGRMPEGMDRVLRCVIVTPGMHTLHHSNRPVETNSNYGFSFSWWDRIFHTYRANPQAEIVLGLEGVPSRGLGALLAWPFRNRP